MFASRWAIPGDFKEELPGKNLKHEQDFYQVDLEERGDRRKTQNWVCGMKMDQFNPSMKLMQGDGWGLGLRMKMGTELC